MANTTTQTVINTTTHAQINAALDHAAALDLQAPTHTFIIVDPAHGVCLQLQLLPQQLHALTIECLLKQHIYAEFPEAQKLAVGVFGKVCANTQLLSTLPNPARIELYAPLLIDPKQQRHKKAQHAK